MTIDEQALAFDCEGETLIGVLHGTAAPARRGVLIVVGGPQYRAGSHRQFTLLARDLASHGIPVLRFDYRGMGDSEGDMRTFEDIRADIRAAIDAFLARLPQLEEVVIWGLCDAASAATFYAHADARVRGVVLLNPWARTVQGLARAHLEHYYLSRLVDPDLWRKLFRGSFDFGLAARSFLGTLRDRMRASAAGGGGAGAGPREPAPELPERMAGDLGRFDGKVLLVLSGNDLTAQEFKDAAQRSRRWSAILSSGRVMRRDLPVANHTFSSRGWRDTVAQWTREWVKSW